MRLIALVSPLALLTALSAQAFYIPNNDATTGTCNVIPFGNATATWANQRYQTLITAADLGNAPLLITGLGFAPCATEARTHTELKIKMTHVPPGFNLIANTNFDQNLTGSLGPVLSVLDQDNYLWENTADTWTEIGLENYFPFNGQSDLLIDVISVGNLTAAVGMHRETRPRLYATGWTGTPPATGRTGNASLKMEIVSGLARATIHGQGCNGLTAGISGSPMPGTSITVSAAGGAPTSPILFNAGQSIATPFPLDLSAVGATGCLLHHDLIATAGIATDATGAATLPLPIANLPGLLSVKLYVSWTNLDSSAPGGLTTSNYGRIVVGN